MGRGLFEYAEVTPTTEEAQQDPQHPADGMDNYIKRRAVLDQSKQLMQSIDAQMQQGTPPQYVLYSTLRLIGLLTGATEWEERQRAALDHVYKDLAQESLFADNAAIAAQRLDDQRREYVNKQRKNFMRQLKGLARMEKSLNEAFDALQELDDDPPDLADIIPQPKR